MNDGRRSVRRRIGAANWALAGAVALCMLLGIGHLEDWASPPPSVSKLIIHRKSGNAGASTAGSAAARDTQARWLHERLSAASLQNLACERTTSLPCTVLHHAMPQVQRADAAMQDTADLAQGTRDMPQHSSVLEELRGRWSVDDALLPTDVPLAPVTICNGALARCAERHAGHARGLFPMRWEVCMQTSTCA